MTVEVTFRKHNTIISILCFSSLQLILDKPTKYSIENFKKLNSILKEHTHKPSSKLEEKKKRFKNISKRLQFK